MKIAVGFIFFCGGNPQSLTKIFLMQAARHGMTAKSFQFFAKNSVVAFRSKQKFIRRKVVKMQNRAFRNRNSKQFCRQKTKPFIYDNSFKADMALLYDVCTRRLNPSGSKPSKKHFVCSAEKDSSCNGRLSEIARCALSARYSCEYENCAVSLLPTIFPTRTRLPCSSIKTLTSTLILPEHKDCNPKPKCSQFARLFPVRRLAFRFRGLK